jgi:hypothetical protein
VGDRLGSRGRELLRQCVRGDDLMR